MRRARFPHPLWTFSMKLKHSLLVVLGLAALGAAEFSNTNQPQTFAPAVAEAWPVVVEVFEVDANSGGTGHGSGVVVDTRGYVLTCYHVVRDTASVTVEIADERVPATIVARDAFLDLALIKIDRTFSKAVRWGQSHKLRPGDFVFSVGFPFGFPKLASLGIVSALNYPINCPCLVIDANCNPGNSGGGLFDSTGALVGIPNQAFGAGPMLSFTRIGFAIPGNTARLFVIRNLPVR